MIEVGALIGLAGITPASMYHRMDTKMAKSLLKEVFEDGEQSPLT